MGFADQVPSKAPSKPQQQAGDGGFDPQDETAPSFGPPDIGWHDATIVSLVTSVSKNGNRIVKFKLRINDTEQQVYDVFTVKPKSLGSWLMGKMCRAIDPAMPGITVDPARGFDITSNASVRRWLLGKSLRVLVKHEEEKYEGKIQTRGRVEDLEASSRTPLKPTKEDIEAWLSDEEKYDLSSGRVNPDTPSMDDDIPF